MKRLISFTVVITMLLGLCITTGVSASVPTYTTYEIASEEFLNYTGTWTNSSDGFSTHLASRNWDVCGVAKNPAINPNGRYSEEKVYNVTSNGDIIIKIQDGNIQGVKFNDGDIIHLTSEMMIPAGKMTLGEYSDYKVGILLEPSFGETKDAAATVADGIRTANRGKRDYYTYGNSLIAGMDLENQHFSLFGNVNTAETWEYDKWYRFDVVLTMGANPTASIYVNGNPLTVEPPMGERTPTEDDPSTTGGRHFDNQDATFDGVHTSSENVSVGYWVGDGGSSTEATFMKSGLWGFNSVMLVRAQGAAESTVYIDDLAYRAMEAGSAVELPDALTLSGVKDGGSFDPADLTAVKVQVPEFIKHKTASVELSVDGKVITDTEGVYDLSNIGGGAKFITLAAKDAQGNVLRTSSMTITLPGEGDIHGLDAITFGGAEEAALAGTNLSAFWESFCAWGEGFYYNSIPRNVNDTTGLRNGLRIITAAGGPDGADDYYAKLEKNDETSGSTAATTLSLGYRYNSARGNESYGGEPKIWNDGIVHLNYDLLLPAYDAADTNWYPTGTDSTWATCFDMCIGAASNRAFNMYMALPNAFTFDGQLPGDSKGVPVKLGEWVHFEWKLDYVNRTAEVKVGDYQVVNDKAGSPYLGTATLEMSDSLANAGFEGVAFNWYGRKGSVGIDNLEIKYELTKPYVKSVDFGDGNAQGNKVLTSATTAAVEIPGKVFSVGGSANIASYVSLVDSNGTKVEGSSVAMAADGKTVNVTIPGGALTAGNDYRIKVSGDIPLGREGHTQTGTSIGLYNVKNINIDTAYTFTAVDNFDEDEVDDGVAGDLTVKDVRFTTHAHKVENDTLAGYAGAGLTQGYKLRADMVVSNSSNSAQTIALVIATYSGNELVSVAIGGDTVVPANAKNLTITSAPIVIGENTNLTAKAFMFNGLGTLVPLSYAYDLLGNVAE